VAAGFALEQGGAVQLRRGAVDGFEEQAAAVGEPLQIRGLVGAADEDGPGKARHRGGAPLGGGEVRRHRAENGLAVGVGQRHL
jgi:hypothetical protein